MIETPKQPQLDPDATVVRPTIPRHVGAMQGPPQTGGRIIGGLRLVAPRIAAVFVFGVAASVTGDLLIRALGRALLSVPNGFSLLKVPDIFPYCIAPIVGCSAAFIAAFVVKKPGPRSIHLFLVVGLKFALLDGVIAILSLPSGTNAGSIVTLLLVIVYPLAVIPALLRFVPRPASDQAQALPVHALPAK